MDYFGWVKTVNDKKLVIASLQVPRATANNVNLTTLPSGMAIKWIIKE
jgi:hypothetical protein